MNQRWGMNNMTISYRANLHSKAQLPYNDQEKYFEFQYTLCDFI